MPPVGSLLGSRPFRSWVFDRMQFVLPEERFDICGRQVLGQSGTPSTPLRPPHAPPGPRQTNGRTPPSQLFSSGVVEALPDALARAEAQLPPAQRPLGLDWTRFLGVMGLCLEGAYAGGSGGGVLAASAVARLFEEKPDDKLEFLTRRRSRLPPRAALVAAAEPAKSKRYRWVPSAGPGMGGAGAGGELGLSEMASSLEGSLAGGGGVMSGSHGGQDSSIREIGSSSVDTGDDAFLESSATGGGSRRREGTPAMVDSAQERDDGDGGGAGLGRFGGGGGRQGARGGGTAALKSLLRPQARHEVFKGYGEAVSRRRERQREALRRAPEPDVEPTRAYKPCGLCQAPFPVESLGSTVSLKVLGNFLARAGAPSERFERKASRLCALHRLPLCVFCSQFFDPDFPGGIVPPGGYTARSEGGVGGRRHGGSRGRTRRRDGGTTLDVSDSSLPSSISSSSGSPLLSSSSRCYAGPIEANGLVPFFDDRFPDRFSFTPLPSSAPAARSHSPPPPSGKVGQQEGNCPEAYSSSATGRDLVGGGATEGVFCGGASGGRGRHHVFEAMELREVGGLVRRGCSIRDRLTASP